MSMVLDDFGQLAKSRYVDEVKDYNAKVQQSKSVSNIDDFAKSFMENDPQFAEVNAKIEQLEQAVEKLLGQRLVAATPLIQPAYDQAVKGAGVDIVALDEQLKKIRATRNYLVNIYGDEVLGDTEKVESRSKSGGGTSSGSGGRRIRGFLVYIDGVKAEAKNAKGEMRSTFSIAAKLLEADTTELQTAFFEAAKSEDVKADDFPSVVEFEFKDHNIKAMKVDDSDDE